jgi:coenzyme F420-reducing hydrogenase alpha subunit
MSRGLLVHHVQLEGRDAAARVASCHVVAPTEWNVPPDGAVARALERLPGASGEPPSADTLRRVTVLMAAYDPCVPFKWEPDVSKDREGTDA